MFVPPEDTQPAGAHRWLSACGCLAWLLTAVVAFWAVTGDAQEDRAATTTDDPEEGSAATAESEPSDEFAYVVFFKGISGKTGDFLELASETKRLADRPPTSLSRLRRRVEGDRPRLLQTLRARANYAATVDVDIDRSTSPITITFTIDAGPVYDLDNFAIDVDPPTADDLDLPSRKNLDLIKGKRASSSKIIDAEKELLQRVKRQGFAHAELGKRRVVIDHDTAKMDVTLRLAPGSLVYFGKTSVVGNTDVETRFITRLLAWKPGQKVTPARIDETRRDLIETSLFNSVLIEPSTTPDAEGRVPVRLEVREAKHRSIEASLRYRTDEGPGGILGWKHRNLLGTGEQLGVELEGSQIGWSLSANAREPDFLRRRQALVIGGRIAAENTDAYDSQSIGASVGIERSVGEGMDLAVGVAFRASTVEQDGDKDSYGLFSLPTSYKWDHSNSLLDPSKGGRLFTHNEPFLDVFGNDVVFNKTSIAYTRYIRLKKAKPRLVLAGRTKVGFLFGAKRDNVPADERFYAGGGGSVRGFGFQLAGELDDDDDPVGGRSVLEFAGELRSKFTDTLGAAVFVDSGYAYQSNFPDFDKALRVGAGAGLRYFSPVGPFRFDIGVPVNRRSSDDAFQIYVSIGQAF